MAEVLHFQMPEGQSYFSSSPLRRSASSQATYLLGNPSSYSANRTSHYAHNEVANHKANSISSSAPSSPRASHINLSQSSSFRSTPASSLSLDTKFEEDEDEDEEITFPSYAESDGPTYIDNLENYSSDISPTSQNKPSSPVTSEVTSPTASTPDQLPMAEDDTSIRPEPSQHVDYLSHDWQEEDIWASWRHIVSKRNVYGQRSRLENASWRTWAKSKYKLRTISPETLNWLKDCDVTWLYGPLQPASRAYSSHASEPTSQISKNNSFIHSQKKPILKKRSMSEVMLQHSISASSLVKQAAAAVQAQQDHARIRDRPIMGRAASDFVTSSIPSRTISRDVTEYFTSRSTSGLQTPENGEKKHIRFDDKVEQCIAVECKDGDYDDDEDDWAIYNDDSSDDEGVVMMKKSKRKISRNNSRSNLSGESKTIAMLPSTTLKYRTDSPDIPDTSPPTHSLKFFSSSKLSPSPSEETIRPSRPSKNFLLEEDAEDDEDIAWEPSGAFANRRDSIAVSRDRSPTEVVDEGGSGGMSGLRRTASGMFMPYEEDEDEPTTPGIIGRVVDTVNTARDIAHVIWNVGWRK